MNIFDNEHLAPNRYFDRNFDKNAVKILPGEYYATSEDTLLVTVLGSCVSACIRDPITGVSGMNHFLLPANKEDDPFLSESARYGVYAMEILINHMLKLGAIRNRLQAKIFGGANVLKGFRANSVGEQNANFVKDYLDNENIRVVATDLLGVYPRKLYLFPDTGEVKVRKLKSMHNSTIIDRESELQVKIKASAHQGGDVDLF